MRKILSLVIVGLLMFSCYNVTATTPLNVYIQAPDNVGQGEEFTMLVQFTNNEIAAWDWKLNLSYNPSLVTVLSSEIPDVWDTPFSEIIIGTNYIRAQSFTANPIIENCTLLKVVFRTISYGNLQLNFNMMKVEVPGESTNMRTINTFQNKTIIIQKVIPAPPIPPPPNPSTTIPPNANTGGIYQAFVNEVITFDGSGSNDSDGYIVAYDWDLGNGVTKSGKIVTYAYTKAGNYEVSLTVTDNDDEQDEHKTYAIVTERNETDTTPPDNPIDNETNDDGTNNDTNNNQTTPSKSNGVSDFFVLIFIVVVGFVFLSFSFWYWRKK